MGIRLGKLLFVLALIIAPWGVVQAEEPAEDKNYDLRVSLGASLNDVDDYAGRVAEYRSIVDMDSTWYLDGSLRYTGDALRFDLQGHYENVNEQRYRGDLEWQRLFLFKTNYERFYHRLDHDTLSNLEAHSLEELFTVTKGSLTKWVSKPAGAGLATVYHDDFGRNDRYGISHSFWKNELKINLPALPGVSFELVHRYEERDGLDQARTLSKCAACHVVAKSKAIHEFTNDWNPRLNAMLGKLTLQYSFLYRTFDNSNDVPYNIYNEAMRPISGVPPVTPPAGLLLFDAELQFDQSNGPLPFARTPETKKWMHVLKAKYDFTSTKNVFLSFVSSDIQNTRTDEGQDSLFGNVGKELDIQYNALMGRFFARLRRGLTLTIKGKYADMDGDDVFLDVNEMRLPDDYSKFPGKTYGEVIGCDCDITRHSSYDQKEYTIESRLAWRYDRRLRFIFGYQWNRIERENAAEEAGYPPVTEDSSKHVFSLTANWRPDHRFKVRADYRLRLIVDPYTHKKAYCPEQLPDFDNDKNDDGWADIWYDKNWYSKYVYETRRFDMSTEPDTDHDFRLKADWILSEKAIFQANVRYYYGENDELEDYKYKRQAFNAGLNLTFQPFAHLGLNVGYQYFWDKTESKFCSAFYHG